jgi:hypothetical protein
LWVCLVFQRGEPILSESRKEALRCEIDLMEKEILYFTGRKRAVARRKYLKLLRSCGEECKLDEPIYLKRS